MIRDRLPAVLALMLTLSACEAVDDSTAVVEVGATLEFSVEVANTEKARREGLAGVALSEDSGMLFPFTHRKEQQVWTAGMVTAIDTAWILDGEVVATQRLEPCILSDQAQCPLTLSPGAVDALLEVPAGSLDGIERGTPVTIKEAHS